MNRKLTYIGLLVIFFALLAFIVFPYYIYTPAKSVISDKYKEGDTLVVYGVITNVRHSNELNVTVITLDGNLNVYIEGKFHNYSIGKEVFMQIKKASAIKIGNLEITYWLTDNSEIHDVQFWDNIFIGIEILGIIISLIGTSIKR